MKIYAPPRVAKQQPDAVLSQDNPVSGTKYTVLDTRRNVRIKNISVRCTWTEQPSPLEIHITIDGQTWNFAMTDPESDKTYYICLAGNQAPGSYYLDPTDRGLGQAFMFEGRSVKIEAEITGGTVSNLYARTKWAKL